MDLEKSRRDGFRRILRITGAGGVIWVHACAEIARPRADFDQFSEVSEIWRSGWRMRQSSANPSPSTELAVDTLAAVDSSVVGSTLVDSAEYGETLFYFTFALPASRPALLSLRRYSY
jgi:hypothetical protein